MFGYTGDDLTNFWGLIGVGVALGAMAVTLAHRIWRALFFGFAALFVLSGLLAGQIKIFAPAFAAALSGVTANPSNWFFVFMVLMVALWLHQFRKETLRAPLQPVNLPSNFEGRFQGIENRFKEIYETLNALNMTAKLHAAVTEELKGQIDSVHEATETERAKISEDLRNAEDARLSQVRRIREETQGYGNKLRAIDLDLIGLLHFAVDCTTVRFLDSLIAECPRIKNPSPFAEWSPDDYDAERRLMDEYIQHVRAQIAGTDRGMLANDTLRQAEHDAEARLRGTPEGKLPTNIHPLDLRRYVIADNQCQKLAAFLLRQRDEVLERIRRQRNDLINRKNQRDPP